MPPTALTDAALQFGLGVDYITPGLVTVTGSVPPMESGAARVEGAIGQGQVTASPFGMALVAASVAGGKTPLRRSSRGSPRRPIRRSHQPLQTHSPHCER